MLTVTQIINNGNEGSTLPGAIDQCLYDAYDDKWDTAWQVDNKYKGWPGIKSVSILVVDQRLDSCTAEEVEWVTNAVIQGASVDNSIMDALVEELWDTPIEIPKQTLTFLTTKAKT